MRNGNDSIEALNISFVKKDDRQNQTYGIVDASVPRS